MPCRHKFESYLNLERLDFKPTTLIVGTFNPGLPEINNASWFYGRIRNNHFWDILPRIYNEPSLRYQGKERWTDFCRRKLIAITDLISCIGNADTENEQHVALLQSYKDSVLANQFNGQIFVDIVELLLRNPSIQNVYLTCTANPNW